jgi:hypothetical protein
LTIHTPRDVYQNIYDPGLVNAGIYMTFNEATDALFKNLSHADLAEALGVSVQLIRQARLSPDNRAYRQPPADWQRAVVRLAERRMMECRGLIETLRKDM